MVACPVVECIDLGLMNYSECFELQKEIHEKVFLGESRDTLLFVQHPPVLTLGANFHRENLLLSEQQYAQMGIQIVSTDRGGDVTYHCPGQLVIYPIFHVARYGKDLHKWLRDLEQVILDVLDEYGLEGRRFPPHTGAWIGEKKIAAIGIKMKRWVNMHGIALNCNNDLSPFECFVPCGIRDYGVTSLSRVFGRDVSVEEVIPKAISRFEKIFNVRVEEQSSTLAF